MEKLTHVEGPIWEEFKSLNYSNEMIEDHAELLSELFYLIELCRDHFKYFFVIPKLEYFKHRTNLNLHNHFQHCEFISKDLGIEIISKEINHFKANIEKLKSILLMPNEQGIRHLKNMFTPQKNIRILRGLKKIKLEGFISELNVSKIESFLINRFDTHQE